MRFKPVPPAPDDLDVVRDAQRAVPLVPGSEADCCARLLDRLDLPSRDVARVWLTFLRALELAVETASGFKRLRVEATPEHLREKIRTRVYGADELLDMLADTENPLDAEAAFERFRSRVPVWETHKTTDNWEATWRERVESLLDWLVLLDLAERRETGYVASDREEAAGADRAPE